MEIEIKHNEAEQSFVSEVDGKTCTLTYEMAAENVIDFKHTYVPPDLRGRNIAAQLVEHGLKYAREKKYSVIPSCSYVDSYIRRHKEFSDLNANP